MLLADQYLYRRQVIREFCGWDLSRVVGVAVHLQSIGNALTFRLVFKSSSLIMDMQVVQKDTLASLRLSRCTHRRHS